MLISQLLAAIIGAFFFLKLKNSHWKFLSIYLFIIFFQEYYLTNNLSIKREYVVQYYIFIGVPLEYIFLYWLYAYKSLKNKKLFFSTTITYILVIAVLFKFKNINEIYSISINVATILLIILVILEFIKQIKSGDILYFRESKMFYINVGVILFYVGNYPYHVLGPELYENYKQIWSVYYVYFLSSNCLLYLFVSMSFLWGKKL